MYLESINSSIRAGLKSDVISRKIYTTFPTFIFEKNLEIQFAILNSISNEFEIPITSIQVAGSSKTGYSYFKNTEFVNGESDLDIAIVDPNLFQKFCETVLKETSGFTDLSKFPRKNGAEPNANSYFKYIARGIFRPDLMPASEAKKRWFNFFNKLSTNYVNLFSGINAGIYFSQTFFEYKQAQSIEIFKRKNL